MPATHHWIWASRVQAERNQDAMDFAEGLPRKGTLASPSGSGSKVSEASGGPGWSVHVVELEEKPPPGPPEFALQRNAYSEAHAGSTVAHPVHGNVTLPTTAAAVARRVEWNRPENPGRQQGVAVRPPGRGRP